MLQVIRILNFFELFIMISFGLLMIMLANDYLDDLIWLFNFWIN
jgi:hypothetical protein